MKKAARIATLELMLPALYWCSVALLEFGSEHHVRPGKLTLTTLNQPWSPTKPGTTEVAKSVQSRDGTISAWAILKMNPLLRT